MKCPICGVSRDAFADDFAWLAHVRLHAHQLPQAELEARARVERLRERLVVRRAYERKRYRDFDERQREARRLSWRKAAAKQRRKESQRLKRRERLGLPLTDEQRLKRVRAREYHRRYRQRHPDYVASVRAWEQRNPDKVRAMRQRAYQRHKDERALANALWRRENAEYCREYKAKYREEHREEINARMRAWAARTGYRRTETYRERERQKQNAKRRALGVPNKADIIRDALDFEDKVAALRAEGWSRAEIAELTGRPENSVKGALARRSHKKNPGVCQCEQQRKDGAA